MAQFKALLISKGDNGQSAEWTQMSENELMDGDVTVRVTHSALNYKDGLAITGKAPVIRRWPMIPGIDLAGVVEKSDNPEYSEGDEVLVNGWGMGETHYGGYAERARVPSSFLVPVPRPFSCRDVMAIGTAGYTAMLCVRALEEHHVTPDKGPILVTGASGGVGSVAIALLAKLGYEVTASTGRVEEADYLKELGAADIIDREELGGPAKPLARERWAGAVDAVGGTTLANILSQTKYGGCVAACGLAQGPDLPASVMPFILRGVALQGCDSVMAPRERRVDAWKRLASDLDMARLEALTQSHPLSDVIGLAPQIIAGKIRGRVVFEVS